MDKEKMKEAAETMADEITNVSCNDNNLNHSPCCCPNFYTCICFDDIKIDCFQVFNGACNGWNPTCGGC